MKSNISILFLFEVTEEEIDYIKETIEFENFNIYIATDFEEQLLLAPQIDIMVGRRVKLEVLEAAKELKHYIYPGTGVDGLLQVFSQYSRKNEVILSNTHRSAYNCAQGAVGLLLGIMNHIFIHDKRMRDQQNRSREPSTTLLRGKTVGLLGFGPINQYVHQFLKGFESDFAILKRSWSEDYKNFKKFTSDQLHKFLECIDVLIIGTPLTSETRGMIGTKELELLGTDGYLVNIARGAIVDQESLFNALKNKTIAAAGLDVWYRFEEDGELKYGYCKEYPFHELDNVILSPHRSNSGTVNISKRWNPVLINVKKVLEGKDDFENVIDVGLGY